MHVHVNNAYNIDMFKNNIYILFKHLKKKMVCDIKVTKQKYFEISLLESEMI